MTGSTNFPTLTSAPVFVASSLDTQDDATFTRSVRRRTAAPSHTSTAEQAVVKSKKNIYDLPVDLIEHALFFGDAADLACMSGVAKVFRNIVTQYLPQYFAERRTLDTRTPAALRELDQYRMLLKADLFRVPYGMMKNVRVIHLSNAPLTIRGADGVERNLISEFEHVTFPHCTVLDISEEGERVVELTNALFLNTLKACPNLQELTYEQTDTQNHAFTGMEAHCRTLTSLRCRWAGIPNDSLLALLKTNPQLTSLDISRTDEGDCSGALLACPATLRNLRELKFNHNDTHILDIVSQTPLLRSLGLSENSEITDSILEAVLERLPRLEELDIVNTGFTGKVTGAGLLSAAPLLKNLRNLDLSHLDFTNDQLIGILSHTPRLTALAISWNEQLTDACLEAIINLKLLSKLAMGGCRISHPGTVRLLLNLPHLKELVLPWLSDKESLNLTRYFGALDKLSIDPSDSLLKALADRCDLSELKLEEGEITMAGLSYLLAKMRGLKKLTVHDTTGFNEMSLNAADKQHIQQLRPDIQCILFT